MGSTPLDSPTDLVSKAIAALESFHGFSERPSQRQLALLISDLIEGDSSGSFEAPTGIGKSLAALIPSLVHAAVSEKRVVIATYTNVLAEQYWRKDVPLALSAVAEVTDVRPEVRMLMGRQRYACLAELGQVSPPLRNTMLTKASIGHESDFKKLSGLPARTANAMWSKIAVPVVCPGRLCPDYNKCYYYAARRAAAKARLIVTNHSVVIQDAIMKESEEGSDGLLGDYDFLILDEAHDFPLAAANGLEFELNASKLQTFLGIGSLLGKLLAEMATMAGMSREWQESVALFEQSATHCQRELQLIAQRLSRPGIVAASPEDLFQNRIVQSNKANISTGDITDLGFLVEECCEQFGKVTDQVLAKASSINAGQAESVKETIRNYRRYLDDFSQSIHGLIVPRGVSVTHASQSPSGAKIRSDTIGLAEPLTRLLWSHVPTAFLSATLAVDGSFDFFTQAVGSSTSFDEVLDAPFDYSTQAALYLPPKGLIPDPSEARQNGSEPEYYRAIAHQVNTIIAACSGRTLVLFHSRKEMEAVAALAHNSPERPLLMQLTQGVAEVGEQFKKSTASSLFALRSFWTGFDAPGETLSCVVLVRIPFEVPIDPPQIARAAHLQTLGLNPFAYYTLPMAKIMMRQGVGRLIRGPEDRGVVAILDPRIHTKRYGDEILDNLPSGMKTFDEIETAVSYVGIGPKEAVETTLFT